MSSDGLDLSNADYDSFGFRVGCSQSATSKSSLPDVVVRNQEHKWRRVLDPHVFPLTPKSKVVSLVYEGVPDQIRGDVWKTLISSSGQAPSGAEEMYRKYLLMPDNKAVEQIKLDLGRTLTHHRMFEEKMGEGQQKLMRVLKAYSYHNSSIGYCQGMSYLAAILLTVLPCEHDAFRGLCQVVGGMEGYFVPSMWELLEDGKLFKSILNDNMPEVCSHLAENGILPLMFLCKWFMTMFSQLPWPTVLRIFDLYLLEGKTSLFRFGYSILDMHQADILKLQSIDVLLPYLLEPTGRKLQAHIIVQHALSLPMEHYLRMAVAQLRDGQDVLNRVAAAGTSHKRHSTPVRASSAQLSSVSSTSNSSSSFFERFLSSIATPVRSAVKRRVDTSSDTLRVVPTPPRRTHLDFGGSVFNNSPAKASPVRSPSRRPMSVLSPSSAKLNTPPMFEGMKKRYRPIEGSENAVEIPMREMSMSPATKLRAL